MILTVKRAAAAVMMTGALSAGIALPASAKGPVITGGLVNVTLTNIANNNQVTVTIPIQAAANICGVSVAVLGDALNNGPVDCTASPSQGTDVTVTRR